MGDAADSIFTRHDQGRPVFWHIPLFLGWLFLYLTVYPVSLALKKKQLQPYQKWIWYYGFPACCFLIISVYHRPQLVWIGVFLLPLFLIHTHYARRKNERALTNDIAGVLFFCSGGLASCWLGTGTLDGWAWFLFLQSALFFVGSSFYVKSVIRERKNRTFAYWSWGYHLLLPFLSALLGAGWAFLAFIPSSLRLVFSRKRLAGENDRHSGNHKCRLLFRRHVYMYHKLKNKDTGCPCFFQSILQISSGQFSHSISHRK